MPKTCIIYPEMDQTVGKYQEQSRTLKDSHHRFKKSRMKTQNQKIKPTIRSEMWRRSRICLLFWILTVENEEQRKCWSLKTKSFEFSWERSKWLERSDNENVRTNGQRSFYIMSERVNRRAGMRVITKSKWLTCQISTVALNVSLILVCSRWKTCELTRQLMGLVEEVS